MNMERYDRQARVATIGPTGQKKIRQATIIIVGVGALGTYAAAQLVRAGIGKLILVDPDIVTTTNLQRQALFTERDAQQRRLKVIATRDHLQTINHEVKITVIPAPLSATIINDYQFDLCLDCTDNFTARDLLNRLAIKNKFDYIFASCAGTYGNVMPISPVQAPCLNCVFPNLQKLRQNDCDLIGVATPLIPIISGLQVSLAIHYIINKEELDFNHLISYDCWSMQQQQFKITKNDACPSCGNGRLTLTNDPTEIQVLCGSNTYYAPLPQPVNLKQAQTFFDLHQLLIDQSPKFIRFKWQGYPISLFKNGKVIMYDLPNQQTAALIFQELTVLAKQFYKGSDLHENNRYSHC